MSASLHTWYSLPDLNRLAERGAVLEGEIELERLPRLNDILHDESGSVSASLRFRKRGAGRLAVEVSYEATLTLECQRCLEPLAQRVNARVEFALLENEAMENYLPEGCEPFLLENGRFSPAQLIEDELIVCLPLAPRHDRPDRCGSLARSLESRDTETGADADDGASPSH